MKRYALLLLALLMAPTASAAAQITGSTVASVKVDGKAADMIIYVNASMCERNAEIVVNLQSLNNPPVLEVWRSAAGACHLAADRSSTSTGVMPACTRVPIDGKAALQNPGGSPVLKFPARDLFATDGKCAEGTQKVYFVPLKTQTPDGGASGAVDGIGNPGFITFSVDTTAPAAPSSLEAANGERQIGVSWKNNDGSDANGYTVYYDPNAISAQGTACKSELLVAGKTLKDDNALESDSEAVGASSTKTSPDSLGLKVGEQIPVAVVARDLAENESVLSSVICVARIETFGFYDNYEMQKGTGLDKCSVQPGGVTAWSHLSLGCLTVLALSLVARRRRVM